MKPSILEQLTWQDVQEIWYITQRTLEEYVAMKIWPEWGRTEEGRFSEALNRLKEKKTVSYEQEKRRSGFKGLSNFKTSIFPRKRIFL